jgi:hypothetical protein
MTTTKLTLTFDKDITGLAVADITLTANSTGAGKETITRTGTGVYELGVGGITVGGEITVSVGKTGYAITPASRQVMVYHYTPPSLQSFLVIDTIPAFDAVTYGYAVRPAAKNLTIRNSGNATATISTVALSGPGANAFELGGTGSTVNAGGSITTRTVQPKAGLAAGTYTATITVTYNGIQTTTATAEVRITVNKVGAGITVVFNGLPQDETIDLGSAQTLSWSANTQLVISPLSGGFGSYRWSLDGTSLDGQIGSGITLYAGDYQSGKHRLTVQVVKNSLSYSKTVTFTIGQ